MKSALLLFTLVVSSLVTLAQKEIPGFGKIDKAELAMKDCEFDKAAEAVVLFDVAEVYCDLNTTNPYNPLRTQLDRHVRIKILNQKGSDAANIHIRYLNGAGLEDIKGISAQTINTDAGGNPVFIKVEKDAIYRKKINKRYSEVIFTFPEVKPGSIIEYKYKDDATDFYALKNWYFQKSIPVVYSEYSLNFPQELIVSATPTGLLDVSMTESSKGLHNIKTFTMNNVPALRDEPYISCDEDYLQQVTPRMIALDFPGVPRRSLIRSWPGIIKELQEDEDFGLQLKKNIPRTADLDALLAQVKDPYTKMVTIHNYVRKNMQWNDTYGIWALDGVKAAWKDKKGTAGEINLILINLLKDADLNAQPVLVSTKDNGRVNTSVAGNDQFNKVMAYVTINNNVYVLDATDKYTPANLIPYDVANTYGLVIGKSGDGSTGDFLNQVLGQENNASPWGWKMLWNEKQLFNNTTFLNAVIDDKGNMKGEAEIISKDYSRYIRLGKLKEGKDKYTEAWLNQNKQDIKIDSLEFENENTDSLPLKQTLKFEKKISSSGDYNYFSVNLFSGLDKNPFIADERFSDIFFGANQKYVITGNFFIPQNYQFEPLPQNIKMIMPDTSIVFSRSSSISDGMLYVQITLEFRKPYYLNQDYGYFQEFYKKLFDFLNEQFVFKKK
ncbi:DUF3857 domain-containing protein [Ferruginibacter profundus]